MQYLYAMPFLIFFFKGGEGGGGGGHFDIHSTLNMHAL